MRPTFTILAGAALLLAAVTAAADKQAGAGHLVIPERNLVNTRAKNVPADFSVEEGAQKHVKWQADLGREAYGGPVVAGGRVFVGTNNHKPRDPKVEGDKGVLMCFDAKNGKFLWQAVHDKLPHPEENDWPDQGVASTPAVDGDRVYYVSNRAEVVCLDAAGDPKNPGKAKVVWTYDMIGKLKVYPHFLANSSPLIVDDMVYVVTGNGVNEEYELPAPEAPSFIALNKKTGELVWQSNLPGKNVMDGQWTSPAFANPKDGKPQVIFPGGDGWLYALEPKTGRQIWKFNCNPKDAQYTPKNSRTWTRNYFLATPVVYEDRVYIGVGQNPDHGSGVGHLFCIDTTKEGDVSVPDGNFDKAAGNKNSALVWHIGGKIDPEPRRGRKYHFSRTISTCAVHDGLVYAAELDGYLHCFDARTGERYWTHDMKTGCWASPYYVDGKVFIGNDDGVLLVFKHGKKYEEPKEINVGPPVKTPVHVAGGVLYFMTPTTLYAIEKK